MLALVVGLSLLAPAQEAGPGSPVAIIVDVDEARLRRLVQPVAIATWKEACALYGSKDVWGVGPAGHEKPAKLHLYQETATYEAACDRLVGGKFKRNMAFTHHESCSSHLVLQPPLQGDAFKQLAPTFQTMRLVAHETAHLARIAALPNHPSHPDWFADGNATWIETKVFAAQKLITAPEQSPPYSTYVVLAQRLLEKDSLTSVEDLLHDRTEELGFGELYAVRWLLFRFLIEGPHAGPFREFLGDVRRFGGGDDYGERLVAALQQRLGKSDWKPLDDEFRAWIAGLKPEWEEIHRSLETSGDDWAQVAFDDKNAIAFKTAPAGTKPYALEGTVTLFTDRRSEPQMNLLLGRERIPGTDHERFVSIAIAPGGGATLFDFDSSREQAAQWKNVAFGPMPGEVLGKPIAFRVECSLKGGKTKLSLKIAGKVVAVTTIDRSLDGPWGLGAQAGSSGIWREVKQSPLGSG